MKLIVCLDEKNGMAFNGRRQSRDRKLIEDLQAHLAGEPLWMLPYSAVLFEASGIDCRVREDAPRVSGPDGFCFLETLDPSPLLPSVHELVIYRWNRHYPADVYFRNDLSAFRLTKTVEFVGSSHEKITKEVWKK